MTTEAVTVATVHDRLTVVAEPMTTAQSVAMGCWLRSGTRHEPQALNGIAHFLEHMVFKGSARRDARVLARELELLGGQVDAYTSHEVTCYTLKVLPEHVERGLDLLADLIVQAAFTDQAVLTEQKVVLEEILESEDSPFDLVQELTARLAWGDHPLAWPVLGTRATLPTFTAATVADWRARHYTADRMILAAAGQLDPDAFAAQVAAAFADLPAVGAPIVEEPPRFGAGPGSRRENVDQIYLSLAAPAPGQADPDQYAVWALDALLGGTMSSCLFQEVRERRGLAYQVSSSWNAFRDAGLLVVEAVAGPKLVSDLLRVTCDEIAKLVADGVSEEDLAWAKEYARATIALGGESTQAHLSRLGRSFSVEGRFVSLAESLNAIERLSCEDLRRVAGRVFGTGEWVLAAVGPVTERRMDAWWKVVTDER